MVRNDSSTNLKSLKTPPISPVLTSPTHGFAHGYRHTTGEHYHYSPKSWPQIIYPDPWIEAVSQVHITEADKDQSTFQEVDLGEMKSRDRDHSANKENVPPPRLNHELKRLAISPTTNESSVSISRIPKVSVVRSA